MNRKIALLLIVLCSIGFNISAQERGPLDQYQPPSEYENIHVLKVTEDSLQSTFIIWVKKSVKMHYHAEHTENIVVLEGSAEMLIGDSLVVINTGDYINIPKGTHHAVTKVLSEIPLKVLSIQAPKFDGADRIFIEE